MGKFTLEGDREKLAPIAEQLGLELVRDGDEARWFRKFPKATRLVRWGRNATKVPDAYDAGGRNDKAAAKIYAQWLAQRDGIKLPEDFNPVVAFTAVKWAGYKKPVFQASAVTFGHGMSAVTIKIPHVGYDPTAPVAEIVED